MATRATRTVSGLKAIASGMLLLSVVGQGLAADWTGAVDDFWSNGGNWVGGVVPVAGSQVDFGASAIAPNVNNNSPADTMYGPIIFGQPTLTFTISGNRLGIGAGDYISNLSFNAQTFTADILSGGDLVLTAGSGSLSFADIVINNGSALTLNGGNAITINGGISG